MSDNMAEMLAQIKKSEEAALQQGKAEQAAKEAAELAAKQSERAAKASEELIAAVRGLIDRSGEVVESMGTMSSIANQMQHLISVNSLLVTIVANIDDSSSSRELEKRMHELAMAAAGKGIEVNTGSQTNIDGSVQGDVGQEISK